MTDTDADAAAGKAGELGGFSGAVLVTRAGSVVLRAAFGTADAAAGVPNAPDTRFQIASVSKQFTGAVAMLLAEDGAVSLDAAISRLLPNCPARWQDLTIHQLLTHTSGLGHWWAVPGFDINSPGEADELLERAAQLPLLSAPGTTWHYSSVGYLLAARIMERITGRRHADLLAERVFWPLGMTGAAAGAAPSRRLAYGYREGRRVDTVEFADLPGAGDIRCTVDDLARWTAAVAGGEILTAASRATLWSGHAAIGAGQWTVGPATGERYGYGMGVGTLAGHRALFHPGDNPGYQAFHAWLPERDVTVVVLGNDEEADVGEVLRRLLPSILAG